MALRDLSRPQKEIALTVTRLEAGMRLDAWLSARVPWRSRADLQRRILDGRILVDDGFARKGARVQPGQKVRITVDEGPATAEVPAGDIPLRILFEDRWLVALDKAPGTVVHPVGRHVMDTVINALHLRSQRKGTPEDRPMIVHRLDRDTSGVLVLAKDPEVRRRLGRVFEDRMVSKTYLAVVPGCPDAAEGSICEPIGKDPHSDIRLKVACVPDGKPSRTDYRVVEPAGPVSLLECAPRTGRQHQIRVHLQALGHPILCDKLYGSPRPVSTRDLDPSAEEDDVVLTRQALHASELRFDHPVTGEAMQLTAPLPEDLRRVLALGVR